MDTQTQIDRLIELAIIQRTELKQLVEQLPQLREHLNAEVEKVFEETEPQLRSELEEWTTKQTADKTAALGVALEAKIADLAKSLEVSTQARYNAIIAEREENARLAAQAEAKIAEHAASLPSAVKEIVSAELARFPRAGEIDQLRKEFAEPRGLNPRGKWQASETYNRLDLVTVNGDSFVSNIDGNKERPSRSATNWTLNAARGMGGGSGFTSLNNVLGDPSAGQIVGSEGGQYVRKTLVAGANITINETVSSITIIGDEGQISLQDGTAAAPSLFFTNDTDTGIYRPAANTLGISVSGAQVAYFDANGITTVGAGATFDGSVHAANGNANNPSLSFTSDDNTGFFRHQPDEIGITLGGTQTGTLTSALATLTSKLLVSSGATTTAATDLLVNPAVKASGNLLDLQVASSSKFSVSSAGNATFGGNLTVSGTTGTIGSNSGFTWDLGSGGSFTALSTGRPTITAAVASGNNAGAALSLLPRGGGSRRTWNLETDTTEAGDCVLRQSTTEAGSTFTNALYFSAARNATFSGNLTVSGNGLNTFGGTGATNASILFGANNVANAAAGYLSISQRLNYGYALFGYNMTGTSGSDAYTSPKNATGSAGVELIGGSSGITRFIYSTAATTAGNALTVTEAARFSSGNLLIGTTTDGGQKLQVNGTALLGTDNASLGAYFDYNGGISGNATLWLKQTTKSSSTYTLTGGGTYTALNAPSGGSIYLRINNSDALTLDSSLNATFAGNVTAVKAGTAFYSIESTVNGALSEVIVKGKNSVGTAREARLGLNKYADDVFSIYDGTTERFRLGLTNGDATFAGTISQTQAAAGSTANLKLGELGIREWGFYATGGKMSIRPSSAGTWSFNGNTDVELLRTTASTSTTTGALVVSGGVGVAGAVNVGGAISIGNTVQTAASVASTHKVTIVIGGVTYYLLATNV